MKRLMAAAACVTGLIATTQAQAGVYTDDLTKCIVKSADEGDRAKLIEFIFAAMAADPAVKAMSNITPERRTELGRDFTRLSERLLLVDCRKEAIEAIKNEGNSVIEASFSVLGSVAMRGLTNNPATKATFTSLNDYRDKDKWAAFYKEAGIELGVAAQSPAPAAQGRK